MSKSLSIGSYLLEQMPFRSSFEKLLRAKLKRRAVPKMPKAKPSRPGALRDADRVTMRSLYALLDDFLTDDMLVISDVGDCLFGAIDLKNHRRTEFLSPAYYTSMGFAVPAAVGVQKARPSLRPLVLVGDGAFQTTGTELSTVVRLGLNPIVVVLNNHGYSTGRQILDGPFNDVLNWRYAKLPEVLGSVRGFAVRTIAELRESLAAALACRDGFTLIDVDLDPFDISGALKRLGQSLGKQVKG